mmetsp:Transcript_5185/g.6038  ORF Transcript_5185/g.6038 Transcript_5185/m.6038 type:complete len:173 (-) Transcript_5185:216-734(-)
MMKQTLFHLLLVLSIFNCVNGFLLAKSNPDVSAIYSFFNNKASTEEVVKKELSNLEKAWRYVDKPLISVGSKGITTKHGNSLRELLRAHTIVKVKFSSAEEFDENFKTLARYANDAGAPDGIEYLHSKKSSRIILFGMPGISEKIEAGSFPPKKFKKKKKRTKSKNVSLKPF